ncbi:MAG: HDOD domain-containing protein [Proteobacteria bacterium]|nr:HDOD domain-containing protein [Pseudomonadota bacterium]
MVSVPSAPSGPSNVNLLPLLESLQISEPRIPPYPAVATALERLAREGASIKEITTLVSTDASLVAMLLRRASSASMRSSAILTLESAIWRLGLEELMRIALATGLGASASRQGPLGELRRDQWRRSLLAAIVCKELAARRGVLPETAFLAGLLHDFGAIVVLACLEELDGPLPAMSVRGWGAIVEELHVDFGGVLARRWKLPAPLAETIAYHHAPDGASAAHKPLVDLVAIVDRIIDLLDRAPDQGIDALRDVPGLGADERAQIAALLPKVAQQIAIFEPTAPDARPSPIVHTAVIECSWPVDFAISGDDGQTHRACSVGPNVVAFHSAEPYQTGWLSELTLHADADELVMLANIKSCEAVARNSWLVTARPFGLGGAGNATWLRIVARTRSAL